MTKALTNKMYVFFVIILVHIFIQTAIYAWTKIVGLTMDDILVEESQKRVTSAATGENQQFLKGFLTYDIIQSVNFIQNLWVHVF